MRPVDTGASPRGAPDFEESLQFLHSLGPELKPELKAPKWDLERISAVLASLGNPHRAGRFVHVAGTNGKGSTCSMIASGLRAAGLFTGLYTSPHLATPLERIQLGGDQISEVAWTEAFREVHAASEGLLARGEIDVHPPFFETVTAMAFVAFARARVDLVVLETGLGGRLDATNVVDAELAVITPIDFDHEAYLGSSLEAIASEKAGILKPGRSAVFSTQRREAFSILERRAVDLNVTVTLSSSLALEALRMDKFGSEFTLTGDEVMEMQCPLAGEHQVENARTAVTALRVLGVSSAAICEGIRRAVWPGRVERIARNPDIILDGAHNPAGARALAAYIERFFQDEPVRIIFGAMRDKAVEEMTQTLFALAHEVILTAPAQPRALNPEAVAELSDHPNLRVAAGIREALQLSERNPMTTFVTGSLFLVAEARSLLT